MVSLLSWNDFQAKMDANFDTSGWSAARRKQLYEQHLFNAGHTAGVNRQDDSKGGGGKSVLSAAEGGAKTYDARAMTGASVKATPVGEQQEWTSGKPGPTAGNKYVTQRFSVPDPYNNGKMLELDYTWDGAKWVLRPGQMQAPDRGNEEARYIYAPGPGKKEEPPESRPEPSHASGGGRSQPSRTPSVLGYIEQIDALANSGDVIDRDGYGIEDTVKQPQEERRQVVQEQAANTFLTNEGIKDDVGRSVVDPATGITYSSPAAARAAGVTNWVYLDIFEGRAVA